MTAAMTAKATLSNKRAGKKAATNKHKAAASGTTSGIMVRSGHVLVAVAISSIARQEAVGKRENGVARGTRHVAVMQLEVVDPTLHIGRIARKRLLKTHRNYQGAKKRRTTLMTRLTRSEDLEMVATLVLVKEAYKGYGVLRLM
ncbi:hypothetical protein DVH05_008400 [Phytophthora capsici]|nr:hypothetical protein DVH05_008400 [Phytophthora capsici]